MRTSNRLTTGISIPSTESKNGKRASAPASTAPILEAAKPKSAVKRSDTPKVGTATVTHGARADVSTRRPIQAQSQPAKTTGKRTPTAPAPAKPAATGKAPAVAKPTTTSKAPAVAKPTATSKAPAAAKPAATSKAPAAASKAPAAAKPAATDKAPAVAKPTVTGKAPAAAKPTATSKAPAVAKPTATGKAPAVAKLTVTSKAPAAAKPTATTKAPVAAKPPATGKAPGVAKPIATRKVAAVVKPSAADKKLKPNAAPLVPTNKQANTKESKGGKADVRKVTPVPDPLFFEGGMLWRMSRGQAVALVKRADLATDLLATDTKHLAKKAMAVYYDKKGKPFAWQVRFTADKWQDVQAKLE